MWPFKHQTMLGRVGRSEEETEEVNNKSWTLVGGFAPQRRLFVILLDFLKILLKKQLTHCTGLFTSGCALKFRHIKIPPKKSHISSFIQRDNWIIIYSTCSWTDPVQLSRIYDNQFKFNYDLGTYSEDIQKLYQNYLKHAIRRQLMIYDQEIVRNDVGT